MKEQNERKRFFKRYDFCSRDESPLLRLKKIFEMYSLGDLKNELIAWKEIALITENSAYEQGVEREDLIDFCKDLLKLAEALYIISEEVNKKQKLKFLKQLSTEARKLIKHMNKLELITEEEQENPKLIIRDFCTRFTLNYTKIEILDLLNAVVTYEGKKIVYRGSLILFYQCFKYMAVFSFMANKNRKLLLNPK